jgi:hypothetical protein
MEKAPGDDFGEERHADLLVRITPKDAVGEGEDERDQAHHDETPTGELKVAAVDLDRSSRQFRLAKVFHQLGTTYRSQGYSSTNRQKCDVPPMRYTLVDGH